MRFEWDEAKAIGNLRKHGISFELALRVFADPLLWSRHDRIENGEVRWQSIGRVREHLLVLVAHTVREVQADGATIEVIRIISARKAERHERQRYENQNR